MTDIAINFAETIGTVKPLHGVNNGPITFGSLMDLSHYYRELAIPYVRIHDPNWPNPLEVDIPKIFPDMTADPDDPASYNFLRTDTYIQSILDTGAKIVYRLGTSIEHAKKKYFTDPPDDIAQWAKVCVGIIKHSNQGWANGFHHNIRYWEIWNEPDIGDRMWAGTFEQYLDLYEIASKAIKAHDPSLMIGGFAVGYPKPELGFITQFLGRCRERELPLDFFTWHTYVDWRHPNPGKFSANAHAMRKMLDDFEFIRTESHLNEWNLNSGGTFKRGQEYDRREVFEKHKNEVGSSFVASALLLLQDAPVDVANYYDAQPLNWYCGIFDMYGVPQKTFYAFKAFKQLLSYPYRVAVNSDAANSTLVCVATTDQDHRAACVMLAKCGGNEERENHIKIRGLQEKEKMGVEFLMVDKDRNLESFQPRVAPVWSADGLSIELSLQEYAVVVIRIR